MDLGFESRDLLLLSLRLTRARLDAEGREQFLKRAMRRLSEEPQIKDLALALKIPLDGSQEMLGFRMEDYEPPEDRSFAPINVNVVSDGYFRLTGIPLLQGREFERKDLEPGAEPVVVVNRAFVERYWPGLRPLGKTVQPGRGAVFSVVKFSFADSWNHGRPSGADKKTHFRDRSRVQVSSLLSFEELRRIPLSPQRVLSMITALVAGLAILLTVLGLYALVSSSVTRKTREIGIRLALGASPVKIQGMVLAEAMVLVVCGVVTGLLLSAALSPLLSGVLIHISSLDPASYLLGSLAISLVALIAAGLPLQRVTRIQPVKCLRHE